jgi:hypothetical protein
VNVVTYRLTPAEVSMARRKKKKIGHHQSALVVISGLSILDTGGYDSRARPSIRSLDRRFTRGESWRPPGLSHPSASLQRVAEPGDEGGGVGGRGVGQNSLRRRHGGNPIGGAGTLGRRSGARLGMA